MGCDIHPVCQVKMNELEWWVAVAVPDRWRDYSFFAALAGVREWREDHPVPLAPRRGLPEGWEHEHRSEITKAALCRPDDAHSDSWCLLSEMEEFDLSGNEDAREKWDRWLELGRFIAKHHGVTHDRVRFLFNFDN